MASVVEHYDAFLCEFYTWLHGGFLKAKNRNVEFFRSRNIRPDQSGLAIDLGAGSGFQSIALAEIGFSVFAIDLNEVLLKELSCNAEGLDINTVHDDMLNFQQYSASDIELIVCMTDTITHLDSKEKVITLFNKAFQSLATGGKLILTFRDYTQELRCLDRFIPVRSEDDTIFTCFLEYEPETVKVHDIVYRRINREWTIKKSFYRKIKLSKEWVSAYLSEIGFTLVESRIENGLLTIVGSK